MLIIKANISVYYDLNVSLCILPVFVDAVKYNVRTGCTFVSFDIIIFWYDGKWKTLISQFHLDMLYACLVKIWTRLIETA